MMITAQVPKLKVRKHNLLDNNCPGSEKSRPAISFRNQNIQVSENIQDCNPLPDMPSAPVTALIFFKYIKLYLLALKNKIKKTIKLYYPSNVTKAGLTLRDFVGR